MLIVLCISAGSGAPWRPWDDNARRGWRWVHVLLAFSYRRDMKKTKCIIIVTTLSWIIMGTIPTLTARLQRATTNHNSAHNTWIFRTPVRIRTSITNSYSRRRRVRHGYPEPIKVIWYWPIANGLADLQHIDFYRDPQCWRRYYRSRTIDRAYRFACDVCFC